MDMARDLMALGGFEDLKTAHKVRCHNSLWSEDTSVHMALGGKMHYRIRFTVAKNLLHRRRIADIATNKRVTRITLDFPQILKIAGVSQLVEIDDRMTNSLTHRQANKGGADESSSSCNQQLHLCWVSQS